MPQGGQSKSVKAHNAAPAGPVGEEVQNDSVERDTMVLLGEIHFRFRGGVSKEVVVVVVEYNQVIKKISKFPVI